MNNNTYLWKTLPSQGVLLKNYHSTGHFSLDNYLSLVGGQAPLTDDQADCPDYDAITGSVDYSGNLDSDPNYGQLASAAGPNAAPGQVLSATATHPVVAIQGNGVKLHLAHGSALATAVGPDVPDRIQGSGDLHTPATWDLTFADVHGTIPIAASRFTIADEQGSLLRPRLSAAAARLPKTVPAGRPLTLELRTTISIGDGKLRYAPSGGRWLAEWDFDVETD